MIPEIQIFWSNSFLYCGCKTVVLVRINILSKIHPVCHNIANGINHEVTQKRLISMLPNAQKLFVGVLSDMCEMYKLFMYSNIAKGIRLHDKRVIFVYT